MYYTWNIIEVQGFIIDKVALLKSYLTKKEKEQKNKNTKEFKDR